MTILFLIADGEKFPVELDVIKVSTYIGNLASNLGLEGENSDNEDSDEDDSDRTIPIQEVKAPILEKVLQWCQHYYDMHKDTVNQNGNVNYNINGNDDADDDEEEEDDLMPVILDTWEREFLDTDSKTIQQIIMAANFLDIKPLLQVSCKFVAELVRGRSPQEIIEAFNSVQSQTTTPASN